MATTMASATASAPLSPADGASSQASSSGSAAPSKSASSVVHPDPTQILRGGSILTCLDKQANPDASAQPKGRNVSGRSWKVRPQKRATSLFKTKANNAVKPWEERRREKLARREALQIQEELRAETRDAKVRKRERRLENERRRAENEFRHAERMAQTLNHDKAHRTLKSMSKKQLRQIKKTRMNPKTGVVEYVSAYTK